MVIEIFLILLSHINCKNIIELELTLNNRSLNETNSLFQPLFSNAMESIPLTQIPNSKLVKLEIKVGTPPKRYNVQLDISSELMWLPDNSTNHQNAFNNTFNRSQSSTFSILGQKYLYSYNNGNAELVLVQDRLSLNGKIIDLDWGLAYKSNLTINSDGIIGLRYNYSASSHSILAQLQANSYISKKVFSLNISSLAPSASRMYIGDFHSDFTKHTGSCDVDLNRNDWKLWISHVYISDSNGNPDNFTKGAYSEKVEMIFSTDYDYIMLPTSFKDYFQSKLPYGCKYIFTDNYGRFECTNSGYYPTIYIALNKKAYKLNYNDVFVGVSYYYIPLIYFSDYYTFILGTPFLHSLHVAFDQDDHKMYFAAPSSDDIIDFDADTDKDSGDSSISEFFKNNLALILVLIVSICLIILFSLWIFKLVKKQKVKDSRPAPFMIESQIIVNGETSY